MNLERPTRTRARNEDVVRTHNLERVRSIPEVALTVGMSFNPPTVYTPQQWIRVNRYFRHINQTIHDPDYPSWRRGTWA